MAIPFLDATQLAQLRADWLTVLDKTCDIKRNSTPAGRTTSGYRAENYTTLAGGVACKKVLPSPQQVAVYASRLANLQLWIVRFPNGTDVKQNDELHNLDGLTMRVEDVLDPGSWSALTSVLASVLRGGA